MGEGGKRLWKEERGKEVGYGLSLELIELVGEEVILQEREMVL